MSSTSEENDDVFVCTDERRAELIRMCEEQDRARKEELALVHEWKRKQKLRRKYVDDEPINDEEYIYLMEQYDMNDGLEELDGDIVPTVKEFVWVLEQLCESDALSIDSLQKIIDLDIIESDDLEDSSFFHKACWNKNITMDIVNHILDFYPGACDNTTDEFCIIRSPVHRTSAYPLHMACLNSYCHPTIILKILQRNPGAIYHMCVIGREIQTGDYDHSTVEGLPLHYYLSRTSNVHLRLVKFLVDRDEEALFTADVESCFAPIHVLSCNPGVNNMRCAQIPY